MGKEKHPAGKCIFCGGPGMTKQHVFPNWLNTVLPLSENSHTQLLNNVSFDMGGNAIVSTDVNVQQGHRRTRKMRNVCSRCNNVWMSNIENACKPLLTKLFSGENYVISNTKEPNGKTVTVTPECLYTHLNKEEIKT